MATVGEASRPKLPRGVRLFKDEARGGWVLMAPERLASVDETAVAILRKCDGSRTVRTIADELAGEYSAEPDEIEVDVIALLKDLASRRLVDL